MLDPPVYLPHSFLDDVKHHLNVEIDGQQERWENCRRDDILASLI